MSEKNNEVKITLSIPGIETLTKALENATRVMETVFSNEPVEIPADNLTADDFVSNGKTATPAMPAAPVTPAAIPAPPVVPPVPPTMPTVPTSPAAPVAPPQYSTMPSTPVAPPQYAAPPVAPVPTVPTAPVTPYPPTPTVPTSPAAPVAPPQYAAPTVPPVNVPVDVPPIGNSFPQAPVTVGSGAPGVAPFAAAPSNVGAAPTYTVEMLSNAGARLIESGKSNQLTQILSDFKVATLCDIKPEQYGAIAERLRAAGANI